MRKLLFLGIILLSLFSCKSADNKDNLVKARDYQILLDMDTVIIYNGDLEVGRFVHNGDSSYNNPYDSIFLRDNQ